MSTFSCGGSEPPAVPLPKDATSLPDLSRCLVRSPNDEEAVHPSQVSDDVHLGAPELPSAQIRNVFCLFRAELHQKNTAVREPSRRLGQQAANYIKPLLSAVQRQRRFAKDFWLKRRKDVQRDVGRIADYDVELDG